MQPLLLLDTDPGVDDALAILMAQAHGRLLGLCVAAGNTGIEHTLRNACRLSDLSGGDVPVFPGCSTPLVRAPLENAAHVHGSDGFGDAGLALPRARPETEHAAQAMLRLTREAPGEITLVALAPLTNLALAVRLDPEFPARVGRLVIMGGAVSGHGNMPRPPVEFNIGFDPEAAHVVFSAFPHFELVDWELALRCAFDAARFDAWLERGDARAQLIERIGRKAREWNAARGRRGIVAADALAVAVALQPDLVTRSTEQAVGVELEGSYCRGATVIDWERRTGKAANARIALELDPDRLGRLVAAALGA